MCTTCGCQTGETKIEGTTASPATHGQDGQAAQHFHAHTHDGCAPNPAHEENLLFVSWLLSFVVALTAE